MNVVGGVITATDGDSDTLTYSLTGTDAGSFEIDSNGQLKTKSGVTHNFNFEATKKSYSVTVNVRDSKDAAGNADTATDDTIAVTIDLTNVNETPTITTSATTRNVAENTTAVLTLAASDVDASDTQTWSVPSNNDGGKFTITTSGALSFTNAPDFETPADVGDTRHEQHLRGDGEGHGRRRQVRHAHGHGHGDQRQRGAEDHDHVDDLHSFRRRGEHGEHGGHQDIRSGRRGREHDIDMDLQDADRGDFTITKNAQGQGELKFSSVPNFESPADAGANNEYNLTVRVRDGGGLSDTITVAVTVTDVNEAPTITTAATTASVAENSTAVLTLTATDVDASDTKTWSVETADDGSKFEISSTGALSFTNAPDFEMPTDVGMNNTYVVTVKVTDSGSLTDTHTLTVTDVNEAPVITSGPTSIAKDENTQTTESIATYEAMDVDANTGTMSWDLQGNDAGDFTITSTVNGTANLFFATSPDFEDAADTGHRQRL